MSSRYQQLGMSRDVMSSILGAWQVDIKLADRI